MTELTIERLGHHGDGIAPGPVFVPRTLPGEVVSGEVVGGRMVSAKIVTPSPDRVAAPCVHAKSCGGCALQHASDNFVAAWKREVVETALAAQGLSAPIVDIITSPAQSRRRATLSGRRTKKGALVGFHMRGSDTIIPVPGCQLLVPGLLAVVPALEALTKAGATRKGALSFTVTHSDDGVDVFVTGGPPAEGAMLVTLAGLAASFDIARLTWSDELIAQRAAPRIRIGGAVVSPPAGAFLQATVSGEKALQNRVTETILGASRVVDLFAGCGTFSLLAAATSEVHAVEGNGAMLNALDHGWRFAAGLKNVTTETRDLYRRPLLPDELARYGAAIIDPPRAGAEAQVREIAVSSLTRMAMVSCNPVSFARDAKILTDAGFEIRRIDLVDQFRWSPHVELIAEMVRPGGK